MNITINCENFATVLRYYGEITETYYDYDNIIEYITEASNLICQVMANNCGIDEANEIISQMFTELTDGGEYQCADVELQELVGNFAAAAGELLQEMY